MKMDLSSSSKRPKKSRLLMLGDFVHSDPNDKVDHQFKLKLFHDAAIGVDEHGKIAGIVAASDIDSAACDVDSAKQLLLEELGWHENEVDIHASKPGQFFFPGFIDTHIHASQYPIAGVFGESTLLDWLNTYVFPTEADFKDEKVARRIYTACVRRTLAHGTTTAAYYTTIHVRSTELLAKLCLDMGQRSFIGQVCMDNRTFSPCLHDESIQESLEKTREVIAYIKEIDRHFELVSPILTPRFALACSKAAMRGLADMHEAKGLPVQTHISENMSEVERVAKVFPDSGSYAKVYDTYGLLTDKTILGHGVHLTEGEAQLIHKRKSKVAHCPCSNGALGSGEARVRWLWDREIDVGLGTDVSGGYSPSILNAARQAVVVSRDLASRLPEEEAKKTKLSVAQVLYLATRGGAIVVGLENKIGGFEVGKDWDAQLVGLHIVGADGKRAQQEPEEESDSHFEDTGNVDLFEWDLEENLVDIIAKWVYNGDDRNTKKVWVRGRLVHSRP